MKASELLAIALGGDLKELAERLLESTPRDVTEVFELVRKSATKEERRRIGEAIAKSGLPNKADVTAVVFPQPPQLVGPKWTDLSKDQP